MTLASRLQTSVPLRLTVPLLSCTLLLTACPGNNLRVIDVPSDPAVLNGTWKGELTSAIQSGEATSGPDRVYLLEFEGIPPFPVPAASAAPKSSQTLVALDVATGAERQRLPLSGASSLRYRAAGEGQPARLLALRLLPAPNTNARQPLQLVELDPVTLATQKQTLLPENTGDYRFSADGRWLLSGPTTTLDTRTLAPVVHPAPIAEQLQPPLDTPTRFVQWDFGGRFLRVFNRPSPNAAATERLYAAQTGVVFNAAARHPSPCADVAASRLEYPSDVASLTDGGAALAYQDGTVELRSREDKLRQTVNLGSCQSFTLRADADVLTVANANPGELITLRSGDGGELGRKALNTLNGTIRPQLVAQGAALLIRPLQADAPLLTLERVIGAGWTVAQKTHTLSLDTKATWVSKTAYTSTGTAVLDGEKLNFTATAASGGYELRPQATPIAPVTWQGELRRADGAVVARLNGRHDKQAAFQSVGLEVQGIDRDFAFAGSLKR
ncbi:hypothetical protein HLB42_20115 (plasmid) [Deinococcus sp. D7000]|nr:hypothetical protein HLB42_20115 [Deinococcus sp. D7000]